jgi:hypothetical protein
MAQQHLQVNVPLTIGFPLPDGRTLVQGPLTFAADGLYTVLNSDFLRDPRFAKAYDLGVNTGHRMGDNLHIEWRAHVNCWAATVALRLPGDFVECGTNTGIFARSIISYTNFEKVQNKKFYLLDTYEGIPDGQHSPAERELLGDMNRGYYNCWDVVQKTFAPFPNVVLVKGLVPDTLTRVPSEEIAYLSIDMNAVKPEIEAAEFFWDKLVTGALVVLDDYGFPPHIHQKRAFDEFARRKNVEILTMPTGQGLIVRPPR